MQASERGVTDTPPDSFPRSVSLHDEPFRALVRESVGERLWLLLEQSIPTSRPAMGLIGTSKMPEDEHRLFRRLVASDAIRCSLQRSFQIDLTFNAEGDLEVWAVGPASARVSSPPADFNVFGSEISSAIAILQLVHGRMKKDGYHEHVPKGLDRRDEDQLLKLMSNARWRRVMELRYNFFIGFRAPFHLVVAKDPAQFRGFVSPDEQVRVGIPVL